MAIKNRYKLLYKYWKKYINPEINLSLDTDTIGSETIFSSNKFEKLRGKVHLIFTSPPYFDKEKYSSDPEQSYLKFTDFKSWEYGFLKPVLKNIFDLLRPSGEAWINIADIKGSGKGQYGYYPNRIIWENRMQRANEVAQRRNDKGARLALPSFSWDKPTNIA